MMTYELGSSGFSELQGYPLASRASKIPITYFPFLSFVVQLLQAFYLNHPPRGSVTPSILLNCDQTSCREPSNVLYHTITYSSFG